MKCNVNNITQEEVRARLEEERRRREVDRAYELAKQPEWQIRKR